MASDYSETVYSFPFASPEAERIRSQKLSDSNPKIHFSSDDYPRTRTFHIEPGVTAIMGYNSSCPADNPKVVFIRLQGFDAAKREAVPILEKTLDIKLEQ